MKKLLALSAVAVLGFAACGDDDDDDGGDTTVPEAVTDVSEADQPMSAKPRPRSAKRPRTLIADVSEAVDESRHRYDRGLSFAALTTAATRIRRGGGGRCASALERSVSR